MQCQFGVIPALYYGFDYLARVYTDLLSSGASVAVEFMPCVCSVAYLIFVFLMSKEKQSQHRLEQVQSSLNLQLVQAVREIDALREAQRKTRIYRHDLHHHLQYLSSCIENGRTEQAQLYIREINAEIEASRVTVYCENEAVNLIFSAFARRTATQKIPLTIQAEISQDLSVTESDLCVLLSNALENALHASQKQKENGLQAFIQARAYEKNGRLFLEVINSCDGNVLFDHGIPITHQQGHGLGVRSICAIVEQYGGIYFFAVEEDRFILRVSL